MDVNRCSSENRSIIGIVSETVVTTAESEETVSAGTAAHIDKLQHLIRKRHHQHHHHHHHHHQNHTLSVRDEIDGRTYGRNEMKTSSKTHSVQQHLDLMTATNPKPNQVGTVLLYGIPIVSLYIESQERLCLAQISNTLLKQFSYNEIHNRRVALGITCVQCTPVQLEILRRAGAMPVSSRRCGMITRREAERLCKSFLGDNAPPRLPEDFAFSVHHECAWGCRGSFIPSRYNSSRAKCIKCSFCALFFSPNKFIFHSHRISPNDKYIQPDAANFNSWRRHMKLSGNPPEEIIHAWEDVKAMFNGGTRKRLMSSGGRGAASSRCPISPKRLDLKEAAVLAGPTQKKQEHSTVRDADGISGAAAPTQPHPALPPTAPASGIQIATQPIRPAVFPNAISIPGALHHQQQQQQQQQRQAHQVEASSLAAASIAFSRTFMLDYMWQTKAAVAAAAANNNNSIVANNNTNTGSSGQPSTFQFPNYTLSWIKSPNVSTATDAVVFNHQHRQSADENLLPNLAMNRKSVTSAFKPVLHSSHMHSQQPYLGNSHRLNTCWLPPTVQKCTDDHSNCSASEEQQLPAVISSTVGDETTPDDVMVKAAISSDDDDDPDADSTDELVDIETTEDENHQIAVETAGTAGLLFKFAAAAAVVVNNATATPVSSSSDEVGSFSRSDIYARTDTAQNREAAASAGDRGLCTSPILEIENSTDEDEEWQRHGPHQGNIKIENYKAAVSSPASSDTQLHTIAAAITGNDLYTSHWCNFGGGSVLIPSTKREYSIEKHYRKNNQHYHPYMSSNSNNSNSSNQSNNINSNSNININNSNNNNSNYINSIISGNNRNNKNNKNTYKKKTQQLRQKPLKPSNLFNNLAKTGESYVNHRIQTQQNVMNSSQ